MSNFDVFKILEYYKFFCLSYREFYDYLTI